MYLGPSLAVLIISVHFFPQAFSYLPNNLCECDNSHFRLQDHYDWGLRAIKSVLVVAGSLKRSDRTRPEEQVLMRALRDFNIPKIVTDDLPVFMGLIGDLFPAMDVPRKRDLDLEATVKQSALVRTY